MIRSHQSIDDDIRHTDTFAVGIPLYDRIGRDRAGILRKFRPTFLRRSHIKVNGDLLHFLGHQVIEDLAEPRKLPGSFFGEIGQRCQLIQSAGDVLPEYPRYFAFAHAAVQKRLHLL